jgi:hypothetical protein
LIIVIFSHPLALCFAKKLNQAKNCRGIGGTFVGWLKNHEICTVEKSLQKFETLKPWNYKILKPWWQGISKSWFFKTSKPWNLQNVKTFKLFKWPDEKSMTSSISFIFTSDELLSVLKKVSLTEFRKKIVAPGGGRPKFPIMSFLSVHFFLYKNSKTLKNFDW